jgi:LysR family hydrogen peroxide-inducible transcriptional activator
VGERVAQQARKSLEEVGRIETVAQHGKDPLIGTLRLGIIHTIAPYLLPKLIPELHRMAPALTLHIEETMTSLLADHLKYGSVDVAIVALPFDVAGIETRPLYDEVFEVIVPKGAHCLTCTNLIWCVPYRLKTRHRFVGWRLLGVATVFRTHCLRC